MSTNNYYPKEFSIVDFKSLYTKFIFFSSIVFISYMTWLGIFFKDAFILTVVIVLLIYSLYKLNFSITRKLILTENELIHRSIFKEVAIPYKEVKSFDVYLQQGNARAKKLETKNLSETSFMRLKFLYISTDSEYSSSLFPSKEYKTIKVHYIPELYQDLKRKIKK